MSTRVSALELKVFVEAANMIMLDQEFYACHAFSKLKAKKELNAFKKLYKTDSQYFASELYGTCGWWGYPTDENQLARELGLLLCAEVLKDETKAKRKR